MSMLWIKYIDFLRVDPGPESFRAPDIPESGLARLVRSWSAKATCLEATEKELAKATKKLKEHEPWYGNSLLDEVAVLYWIMIIYIYMSNRLYLGSTK